MGLEAYAARVPVEDQIPCSPTEVRVRPEIECHAGEREHSSADCADLCHEWPRSSGEGDPQAHVRNHPEECRSFPLSTPTLPKSEERRSECEEDNDDIAENEH